ncbi:MAG: PIN domain-containing protein [Candidatus Aenigmarchaeota archaeon]|nr:PIN domain-containing protein [Candidatus Aenigmarchaeota archaeon]
MKILLDTNFIMDLCKFRIDLADVQDLVSEPVELCILNKTLNELEFLSKKAKHGKYAKLSLLLITANKIKILDVVGDVDKNLLALAGNFLIATNDGKLRQKLKQKGMKTIYLRARKHLAIG